MCVCILLNTVRCRIKMISSSFDAVFSEQEDKLTEPLYSARSKTIKMFRFAVLLTVAFGAIVTIEANESSSNSYHYKGTKVAADMVLKMKPMLRERIIDLTRDMENECKFVKAMRQYGFSIEMAMMASRGACPVEEHISQLDVYEKLYKSSLLECFDELNLSTFETLVDSVVSDIAAIDNNATTRAAACDKDEACQQEVYKQTHQAMTVLYADKMPELKVTEEKAITESMTSLAKCMVPKVSGSLREMYSAIEKVHSCIANGGPEEGESKSDEKDEEKSDESESSEEQATVAGDENKEETTDSEVNKEEE